MFVLEDQRTGKFLRNFPGSFDAFKSKMGSILTDEMKEWYESCQLNNDIVKSIVKANVLSRMFSANVNDAKLYKRKSSVLNYKIALNMPWVEIVEVKINEL